jgi:LysR family transcriptional regulator (chromosome initiation inhibitor)
VDIPQLHALAAAVEHGSFDAAARALHITPSAVSQRIKALESSVGAVLVQRSKPTIATEVGAKYVRLARQLDALLTETRHDAGPVTVPVAVSSDALATWVLPALATLERSVLVDVRREDQDHSAALLRAGAVMAAITTDPVPVQGCVAELLGTMRYRPVAAPAFAREWFPDGGTVDELRAAPVVVFDRKDDLQDRYLRARSTDRLDPPRHHIPESVAYARAVALGLGWGMLPPQQSDGLVIIDPHRHVDVTLYWQQWALRTPGLDAVADAVRTAAARELTAAPRRRS